MDRCENKVPSNTIADTVCDLVGELCNLRSLDLIFQVMDRHPYYCAYSGAFAEDNDAWTRKVMKNDKILQCVAKATSIQDLRILVGGTEDGGDMARLFAPLVKATMMEGWTCVEEKRKSEEMEKMLSELEDRDTVIQASPETSAFGSRSLGFLDEDETAGDEESDEEDDEGGREDWSTDQESENERGEWIELTFEAWPGVAVKWQEEIAEEWLWVLRRAPWKSVQAEAPGDQLTGFDCTTEVARNK